MHPMACFQNLLFRFGLVERKENVFTKFVNFVTSGVAAGHGPALWALFENAPLNNETLISVVLWGFTDKKVEK